MLWTLKIFEVDISFKQVGTVGLNKVVIAVNVPGINKGIL
jgi:hypothetical protein